MIYITIIVLAIGAVVLTAMGLLLGSLALEKYQDYRERQWLRIRDDRMRRYGLTSELPTRRVNK
jgi:hypothetical protein